MVVSLEDSKLTLVNETSTHWIYYCPVCLEVRGKPDLKGKLYVSKDKPVGFCFLCNSKFKFDSNVHSHKEISTTVEDLSDPDPIQLSNFNFVDLDNEGIKYLLSRNKFLTIDAINNLEIKLYSSGSRRGVVVPFYLNGNVVSYQIRFFNGKFDNKYYTKTGKKVLYSPNKILNKNSYRSEITLVEGVFDAIACMIMGFPNPLAILGSSLTKYGLELVGRLLPEQVIVALDEIELSRKVAETVSNIKSVATIKLLETNNKDPEEILNDLAYSGEISKVFYESYDNWRLYNGFKVLLLPV